MDSLALLMNGLAILMVSLALLMVSRAAQPMLSLAARLGTGIVGSAILLGLAIVGTGNAFVELGIALVTRAALAFAALLVCAEIRRMLIRS